MDLSRLNAEKLIKNLHAGVVVYAPDSSIIYANPAALTILRITNKQALEHEAFDNQWNLVDEFRKPLSVDKYPVNLVIKNKTPISNIELGVCDGSCEEITWVLCNAYPEFDENNNLAEVVTTFTDITHQKQMIPFKEIVELANDVILVTEADPIIENGPKIVYANQSFTKLTGYHLDEVRGKTPRILQGPKTQQTTRDKIRHALENKQRVSEQILNYKKSGEPYWIDMNIFPLKNALGEVAYYAAIERDVTKMKQYQAQLKELTIKDPLTNLLNRRGFIESSKLALDSCIKNNQHLTLTMIDVDHFKQINDKFGHESGDLVLQSIAATFKSFCDGNDIVARLGGEEFCIVSPDKSISSVVKRLAKLQDFLKNNPVELPCGERVSYTVSNGVSSLTSEPYTLQNLLKNADKALYRAKKIGRDQTVVFNENLYGTDIKEED
ncbi:diguanylate cyclase [Pseudoalteromonas sp.]|uniref:sensor domain-containing diguanylate cyclase n=1 Tax=Pseudoalteromonas sp. TaxID=53249 RepID=UPI003563B9AD